MLLSNTPPFLRKLLIPIPFIEAIKSGSTFGQEVASSSTLFTHPSALLSERGASDIMPRVSNVEDIASLIHWYNARREQGDVPLHIDNDMLKLLGIHESGMPAFSLISHSK